MVFARFHRLPVVARRIAFPALAFLAACTAPSPTVQNLSLSPVGYTDLAGWTQETPAALLPMLREECRRFGRLPPETHLGGVAASIPNGTIAGDWSGACAALNVVPNRPDAARSYFETWFAPYLVQSGAFYTGYYEPLVYASPVRQGDYRIPLYAKPADLIHAKATDGRSVTGRWDGGTFRPYYSRAEIDRGALDGKGLELAWLRSAEDLFFLQIQGSGRLLMPDGSVMRVGFAARNGQNYVPIGKVLVRDNELASDQVSMSGIRNWLAAHPDRAPEIMEQNPNYVFFRRVDAVPNDRGAPGAMGIPLTPGRSIAVDRAQIPLGAPVWVETQMNQNGQNGAWDHLTLAQDIGSDIKGAGRADIFTGWGPTAEQIAGNQHSHGRMIVLLPRPPA